MTRFEELQQTHQHLLDRMGEVTDKTEFVREVQDYVSQVCEEAADVPAPRDRDQLRANLRFWASYVYDATGTYPNTTMRPPRVDSISNAPPIPSTPQPWPAAAAPRRMIIGVGIVIAVVGLICVGLILVLSGLGPATGIVANPAGQATIAAVATQSATTPTPPNTSVPTKTAAPARVTPVVPATKTPLPTATPAILVTTYPNAPTLDLITPTPGVLIPVTGGGPLVWIATSTAGLPEGGCGRRAVLVTLPAGAFDAELSLIGSGEVVARATLDASENAVSFDLSQRPRTTSYLLQVTDLEPQSPRVFASVIIYFAADCSRDVQAIKYVEAPEELRATINPSSPNPALPLRWYLATWGPAPSSGVPENWVTQIMLLASGGNGYYVYFANNEALPANSSTAQNKSCQPISQTVGVTSNGLASSKTALIMSPFPECPSP